jgi:light-regulated signal transduction histidine kinase (bacteriophytochrome)
VRLAQVFANLLNNAAKYTPPDGRIRLDVATEDDRLVLRVSDNGGGFDPTAPRLTPQDYTERVRAVASRTPLSEPVPDADASAVRRAYVDFLLARVSGARTWLPGGAA